ncbi:hypothetical protein [Streptosporangium sp. KLBMP 9127]|nr:hypothetical protein [Streptosporangium sp. KLBMP 9127]
MRRVVRRAVRRAVRRWGGGFGGYGVAALRRRPVHQLAVHGSWDVYFAEGSSG